MASLISRNGTYYIDFHDSARSPCRRRISLRTKSEAVATRLRINAEDAYALGRWDPWVDSLDELLRPSQAAPVPIGKARDTFLAKREPDYSPSTYATYRRILNQFARTVGERVPIARITGDQITAYVRPPHIARSTQRTRYSYLRAFFEWCRREGYVSAHPLADIPTPKQPIRIPRAVTPDDLERICSELQKDYKAKMDRGGGHLRKGELLWLVPMWWFALYTGLRVSELGRLKWSHIDRDKRLLYIYKQKSGKQQTIPLNKAAARVLDGVEVREPEEYVFHSPNYSATSRNVRSFAGYATSMFRRYRKKAGIERRLTTHGLRHGHCTLLAERGKSAYIIMASARHASVQTSMVYVSIQNDHLRSELDDALGD